MGLGAEFKHPPRVLQQQTVVLVKDGKKKNPPQKLMCSLKDGWMQVEFTV